MRESLFSQPGHVLQRDLKTVLKQHPVEATVGDDRSDRFPNRRRQSFLDGLVNLIPSDERSRPVDVFRVTKREVSARSVDVGLNSWRREEVSDGNWTSIWITKWNVLKVFLGASISDMSRGSKES